VKGRGGNQRILIQKPIKGGQEAKSGKKKEVGDLRRKKVYFKSIRAA